MGLFVQGLFVQGLSLRPVGEGLGLCRHHRQCSRVFCGRTSGRGRADRGTDPSGRLRSCTYSHGPGTYQSRQRQTISHTRHQEKSPRQACPVAQKPRPARRRGFGGSPRSWKPRHTAGLGPFKGRSVRNSRFAGRSQVLKWLPNLFLHDFKNLHGSPPGFSAPSKVLTGSVPKLGTFCQQPGAPQKLINPQPGGL